MIFSMQDPHIASLALTVASAAGWFFGASSVFGESTAPTVIFNRDIRPVLTENCFHCHGPDPGSRKASLRLDTREGFFTGTDERGPTIVAGKPEESPLYQRLVTKDEDDVMPPPDSHKELKAEEIAKIRQWIVEGAPWQPHWSYLKPERGQVPAVGGSAAPVRNAIDAFVFAKLKEKNLTPNAEADRRTLARRLSLDLTGLPPTPAEVEGFVADQSPDYFEKFVEQKMASPHYGEHMAKYWLDAARYGDTHGLHYDNYREMWPYRDWVIGAFNRNLPFDQFTTEQLAGDLLPNPTDDQKIATGFQRCNITTNEGGTIVEENLANYARDRVETLSWVYLGVTGNCLVCHDHKFDPFTMRDFYSMSAFFRNTTQPGLDGNVKDSQPSMIVPQGADRDRWVALPGEIERKQKALADRRKAAEPAYGQWVASLKAGDVGDGVSHEALVAHAPLTEGVGDEIGAVCGQPMRFKSTGQVIWKPDGKIGPSPVFKAGSTFDLGNQGDFERNQAFSYGAWVKTAGNNAFAGIIARMDEKRAYRGWDLWQNGAAFAVHIVSNWPGNALKVSTKKNLDKPNQWQHVFVTYDGSGKAGGVRIFVDGEIADLRTDADALSDTIRTAVPLKLGQRSDGAVFEGGALQDVRVYGRRLHAAEVKQLFAAGPLRAMAAIDAEKRTPEQRKALFDFYLTTKDAPFQALQKEAADLEAERDAIKGRSPVTHIQMEKANSEPMANILFRGQYDQPKDKVGPAVFAALHPMPANAPKNRLGLSQWLNSPENPLTARVTVNRLWQQVFGTGIVKSAEDFGIVGDPPVNQPLLDWLAVEFRESGWNVKHLMRLIVTSSAYRQAATATPEKIEADPQNRLLSRGPRFRMDAEMVRDYALAASGLLVQKIGGPSVKPYQPDGVWEAVAMPESNTRNYKRDAGESLYRRSLYTFWKRSAPPASLEVFNATSREASCIRRERTNTPLQALVTLDDPQFIEAARVLAQKSLKDCACGAEGTLDAMARRLLSRPLKPEEVQVVTATRQDLDAHYRANPEDAKKLVAVGDTPADPALDPALLATWTMIANQLMNLDEVLNK